MNGARLWIVWFVALALGALAGGTDLAFRQLYNGGAGRRVLLLPREATSDEKRAEMLKGLLALPEAAGARWLAPGDIAQEAAQSLERDRWPEIFPQDDAWLPWMAELTLRNPYRNPQAARDRVRALKAGPAWRLVIWDEREFEHDRAALARLLALAGSGALLGLFFGMQAIRKAPAYGVSGGVEADAPPSTEAVEPTGAAAAEGPTLTGGKGAGRVRRAAGGPSLPLQLMGHLFVPVAGLAGLGAIAWALGIEIDAEAGIAAGAAVLILAGFLPLVLKGQRQS